MHDLTAQVTSSLLPFPAVTVEALGEDEITLDSVLHGKFSIGRGGLAWLACGPHLEVAHAVTGERLSAYCFSSGGEHPPTVLAARDFSWLKRSGLLVGLEEAEGSVLCLYDLGLSRVVKAVVIPGRITAIEPLVSCGGASTSTQHLHQSLRWFFGIAAVVTDLGHVLLVDLCLDDLSCSQTELEASDLQVVTKSPAEIPRLREVSSREGRHLCLQLNAPTGVGATALQYISRTNQLAVGFSDGYLQLWNMKALKKEYHSQLEGGRVPVHAFTFQEPENDPRNCCYLWAVQSSQDLEGDMVSLHLLQLAYSERKCLASGKILYEGLEYCEERYSQELSSTAFPLRAQTTSTRLLSCQTIEKFRPHPDRDESMNEVASPDISVSIFSWQVKAYGQGAPSTYIGVFDINRWYHAQMPDSLRAGESLQNCPYLAVWCMDPVVQMVSPHTLLDVVVHDRSLSRGLPLTCPPPEQYFNPTTYNFDATCLLNSGIVHLTCSGYQKETLSFLKKAAPCSSEVISTSYSRCLMSGLLSSRLSDTQPSSLSQEEQLDAILSTAVETSSLGLITGCIKQWTAEEQPGSALNLRYILDWAWKKVVQTKEELDGICAPLFDSSSNFTDPQTMQLLQHSQRLLGNLSTIFHCLLSEAQELTQKGLVGLINKNMVSSLISKYAQVVLWFCRTGLLPEGSDDNVLQFSRPFYTHSVINSYYTIRREELSRLAKGKWCADCLMIDGLVGQCGEQVSNLWKRDDGGTGQYPPPTLHALLDIYLLDNIDEATKHAIVIYLLLDVMYSFPNKEGASVESFPTAFAIPIGLVKLVQGLWLLDHHDHQSSFELLLHPAASQCQFEWQHERVLQALMCQGQHPVALRYFQVTKPPISSTAQAKLCLSVLLHNRCLIEAWALLRQHSNHLNLGELLAFLYESCQELNLIKELLKLPLGLNEQGCLEKFLQGTGGLHNRELLMVHYLQQANYIPALQLNHSLKMNLVNERDPKLKERSNSRNSILDQYGKVLPRVQRKLAMERAKPYQHPSTIHKEVSRPQPLSTITKRSATEKVVSRAGFINNVLTKIEEVWLGKGASPQPSPAKRAPQFQSPDRKAMSATQPDPFLGTPIIMTSKRKSRLMDLVVHPASQTPRPLLCPPIPPGSWVSPKSSTKAPELSLLQTPQVVKRARALAASGPVFPAFTPQSILRSSLRPTPVATPSASPGRSITPPLRGKESRITFIGEEESPEPEKSIRWTNGVAADSEISLLTRGSTVSKALGKTWSSQASKEDEEDEEREQLHVKFLPPDGGIPSPQLGCSEEESLLTQEATPADGTKTQLTLSFNTSQTFTCSADTTLEYYDAPLSADQGGGEGLSLTDKEDEIVTLNIRHLTESNQPEQNCLTSMVQTPPLPSINAEVEEPERVEGETSEEVTEVGVNEEDRNEDKDVCELEDENEELTGIEDAVHSDQEDVACHNQENNKETDGMDVNEHPSNAGYLLANAEERPDADIQSELTEATAFLKKLNESENTEPTKEPVEESADLTDFVQRHLFGSGLSPPLTRSGIHTSRNETTFNSEPPDEIEEKEPAAAEAPPVFTSQKSTVSVTSSEPTGTDSHSVVSVNDSEDLSSPASGDEDEDEEDGEESDQDEEEEEEEEEEDDEEDSGSEVEIIEEVQGNGRLQPSSVFIPPDHTHFLPTLSEQAAAELSLIAPDTEMKMIEDEMEGEVVMVRLGADAGQMETHEDMEQGSSFVELKPSTTLLVPLELVEGQQDMLGAGPLDMPELQQTIVPDEQPCDSQCSFSLMLDMDEDGDKDALSVESDQQSSKLPPLTAAVEATENFVAKSEVILLSLDEQDTLGSVDVTQEDKRKELDKMAGAETDGQVETEHQVDPHPEITEVTQKIEDAEEQTDSTLQTAQEMPEPQISSALVEELAEVLDGKDASEGDNSETVEDQKEPEMEATVPHADASTPVEEQDHGSTSETVEDKVAEAEMEEDTIAGPVIEGERVAEVEMEEDKMAGPVIEEDKVTEVTTEDKIAEVVMEDKVAEAGTEEDKPAANDTVEDEVAQHTETVEDKVPEAQPKKETTRTTRAMSREDGGMEEDEQVLSSSSRTEEQPAPPSQTKAPSTPTRRATRASRAVSFVSPPVEEDEGAREAPIPASLSQTPRKTKQNKETITQGGTPRRSTRITQPEAASTPAAAAVKVEEVVDADQSAANTSVSASPSRRRASQRNTSTRSSLRTRSSSKEEEPAATGLGEEKDEVPNRKTSRQTPSKTPAKGAGPPLTTPRRSTRRVLNNSEMPQTPLDAVREEEEIEVSVPAVKRSTRKTKIRAVEPEVPQEEEAKTQPAPSPSRSSRQSNRINLENYSKIARKTGGETVTENSKVSEDLTEHNSSSAFTANRRPTRTKLWDHPQEDLFLLDSPLEVDSETPVADALIKRLQDEEEKQEGEVVVQKMVRGSKRSTRSSVDPAKEEPLPESISDENSFIYSPSRRRTRASQAEHPGPSDAALLPVTRSTRRKNSKAATKDETPSEEDNDMELEKAKSVSKTRKTGKRTAKSKAVLEPPPLAHVDLLSPLPSPVDPAPRAQKRTKEAEAPVTSTINLRRKRIMNIVFNKPVTRRKKL